MLVELRRRGGPDHAGRPRWAEIGGNVQKKARVDSGRQLLVIFSGKSYEPAAIAVRALWGQDDRLRQLESGN